MRDASRGPGVDLKAPTVRKQVAKKQRQRLQEQKQKRKCRSLTPADNGLPHGQAGAREWVILDLGLRPSAEYSIDPSEWKLLISGKNGAVTFSLDQLLALQTQDYGCMWHCVTGWSAGELQFSGIPIARILSLPQVAKVGGSWCWLMQHSADGYSAPVERLDAEQGFLAVTYNGEPIPHEHGGPRLVMPQLYGWKSAKWLVEVQLLDRYEDGFWSADTTCSALGF